MKPKFNSWYQENPINLYYQLDNAICSYLLETLYHSMNCGHQFNARKAHTTIDYARNYSLERKFRSLASKRGNFKNTSGLWKFLQFKFKNLVMGLES